MPAVEALRDRLEASLERAGALRDRFVARLERAEDPQRVAALVTLWILWLGGTAGFLAVDRLVAGVDVPVFDLGWGLVTLSLVVVAAVTIWRQY